MGVGGNIYILGGEIDTPGVNTSPSNQVLEYTPNELPTEWHYKTSSGFTPRMQASCAAIGNLIYVIGGTEQDGLTTAVESAIEVYDVQRDSWRALQSIGWTPRTYTASAALNGKIYVFGGGVIGPGTQLSTLEVLDPQKTRFYWYKKN